MRKRKKTEVAQHLGSLTGCAVRHAHLLPSSNPKQNHYTRSPPSSSCCLLSPRRLCLHRRVLCLFPLVWWRCPGSPPGEGTSATQNSFSCADRPGGDGGGRKEEKPSGAEPPGCQILLPRREFLPNLAAASCTQAPSSPQLLLAATPGTPQVQ